MSKQWKIATEAPQDLQNAFPELNRVVLQLLYNRGITEPAVIENFLSPEYKNLYDPFLFQDMEKAVERIWLAIQNDEKIVVYGDYDADGVTASAVLMQTFRFLDVPAINYIPERFTEGYGLNVEAFEKFKAEDITLVISVDCGTNSIDVANYCRDNGIDLIITDHHEITGQTPEALALINPKNVADMYPDDQITGVGVAYKVAKALLSDRIRVTGQLQIHEDEYRGEWDKWLLDLVAIGTVADCHSLFGENRILVKFGLKVLAKTKWLGLKQLMENANIDVVATPPDSRTLGFTIAPRINAAGRLEHANIALDLLLATDFAEAITLSNRLEEINRRRQDMTGRIVSQAKEQAELIIDRLIIMVSHEDWPKGLVGLVAGKLAESYKKPVIVLSKGDNESTGSGRTSGNFDLVDCLKSASEHIIKFGGHKQAAGLSVANAKLDAFYESILKYAQEHPTEPQETTLNLEARLTEQDLTLDTFDEIAKLEPFGVGNIKPIFALINAKVQNFKLVGSTQAHLQMQLVVGDKAIDCIGFSMARMAADLEPSATIDAAGELIADSWNGVKRLKFKLISIKKHVSDAIIPE